MMSDKNDKKHKKTNSSNQSTSESDNFFYSDNEPLHTVIRDAYSILTL